MNKQQVKDRWKDAQFLTKVAPLIERIFVNRKSEGYSDLRGIVVGLDGAIDSLLHSDFQDAELDSVEMTYSRISCPFSRCRFGFTKCDSSNFDTCRFKESRFVQCSFNDSQIESPILDDAMFTECVFDGTKIHGRGSNEYGGKRVIFDRCQFIGTSFRNLQFRAGKFLSCSFENVTFTECILSGTSFIDGNPPRGAFVDCEISRCTLNCEE